MFNIQQEKMSTQKRNILFRFIGVRNRRGRNIFSGLFLKGILGISGRKNYNRKERYFYARPSVGQNLKGMT